ncbi:conserved hypothetical protein [Segniliparus rotundus DSM 44985]|uniref:Uncharacterized protein n=1 Tax=Segniliparus rotundus (strain ATCC BAA-972 / CDC 1076 / CIP 108378 / DSM 44985 / JCM 13578) TaxID=640132 RepID=D6ZEQ4_SEGRD|nr:DUF4192 family protein [Segniliparus rotundus]ADG97428.1 conserved hypothetical protein [Segniliparus rotundus DSM 44985]
MTTTSNTADPGCFLAPPPGLLGPHCQGVVSARAEIGSREALRELLKPNLQNRARVVRAARRLKGREDVVAGAERHMLRLIRSSQSSATIGPVQAARFAEALRERGVRDRLISATVEAALASGAHDQGSGAHRLWLRLAPMLPDDSRAEAALLLALDSYARGKGAAARIALEVALAVNPAHELAQLLEACLFTGVRPDALGVLIQP